MSHSTKLSLILAFSEESGMVGAAKSRSVTITGGMSRSMPESEKIQVYGSSTLDTQTVCAQQGLLR